MNESENVNGELLKKIMQPVPLNMSNLGFPSSAHRFAEVQQAIDERNRYNAKKDAAILQTVGEIKQQNNLLSEQVGVLKEQNKLLKEMYENTKTEATENKRQAKQNKIFGWVSFAVGTIIGIVGVVLGVIF